MPANTDSEQADVIGTIEPTLESLESGALIRRFADAIEDEVDELLADGVMTASVVVRRIFFACVGGVVGRRYSNILKTQ